MQASVIVPTLDRCVLLERTLRSLVAQCPSGNEYEIIVVDNGSTDDTPATVDRVVAGAPRHRIRYVYEPVPGLLAGRHRGVREAEANLLVFVDDDVRTEQGWLEAMLRAFDDPTVEIAGGRSIADYEEPPPAWLRNFWSRTPYGGRMCVPLSLIDMGDASFDVDPAYVWGLNLAIRRKALLASGGFNPDSMPEPLQMWQGDGETGLARKARAARLRAVYAPGAVVCHAITAERLTPTYFERRGFYQGVCDSFTDLRNDEPRAQATRAGLLRAARYASLPFRTPLAPVSGVRTEFRFQRGYSAGYRFHNQAALTHDEVLGWVRKPDYWDYTLPQASTSTPACTLLMLITPPELPIVRYTVPALKHAVARGNVAVVLYANGLNSEEETELAGLARGIPNVGIRSNRDRMLAERNSMRIGEWYVTDAGRRELRVGLYESAPEVWERELSGLGTPIVGMIDADFEFLSGSFLQEMLQAFDSDSRVAVVSTDWDPTRTVFDSYSGRECVLTRRHHTWCCLYSAGALQASRDFSYFEEERDGVVYKRDHSARLQEEIFGRGLTGRVLPRKLQWQFVHYGRFAQNRSLGGTRLSLYRQIRIGRHNGWVHRHRVRSVAPLLRALAAILYVVLGLGRYEKERSRYRWE